MLVPYNDITMNISTPSQFFVDMSKTFKPGFVPHLFKETNRLPVI